MGEIDNVHIENRGVHMKKHISLFMIFVLALSLTLTGCQASPASSDQAEQKLAETAETAVEVVEEIPEGPTGIILADELQDLAVRDAKGMNGVIASANPYATNIGMEIMKKGGNAIDAAVAISFTLGLVEPNASGPGGYGTMIIHDATTGEQAYLDYMGTAPVALTQEIYESYDSAYTADRITGKAALVPGAVDGWLKALDTYGTMSIDEILDPVIELAEQGYAISPHMVDIMADNFEKLASNEETAKVFLNDGLPYGRGDIVLNQDYADFLKVIANEGRDGFYKGAVAQSIVDAVQSTGGLMTMDDLANYKSVWRDPIRTDYRGFEVITAAPPSAGGVALLEALNILENVDMKELGANSPESLQLMEEALKFAHSDRYNLVGDPDYVTVDTDGLLDKDYAKFLFEQKVKKEGPSDDQKTAIYDEFESAHTTHFSVMDKAGNMVSTTNTISLYFGCGVTPKDAGFALNSATFNFSTSYDVNKVKGGNRARSTVSPTVVLKDGKSFMTVGTPGGSRIPGTIMQVLVNVIDHEMGMQEAIELPRMHQLNKKALYVESSISEETRQSLLDMGHKLEVKGEMDSYFGGVHAILRDNATGEMHGGADPRRDGKALGY